MDSFLNTYQEQLHSFALPKRLSASYQLRNCLKQSSSKEIYLLADDRENSFILKRGTGKQVALIKQEYAIFQQLEGIPGLHIPKCIDCWEEEDSCYLLRCYIPGSSLSDYFEKKLYLTNIEIVDFMLEICSIIRILHSQQPPIIHRDIKPENFILQKGTGTLYLIDFDIARQYTADKSRDTLLMGTPSHAAPEQFGFSQSDVRTDIYSLGKTMLYLSSGTTEDRILDTLSIDKTLRKIIEHCISFSPEQRYSDIKELMKALEQYRHRLIHHIVPRKTLAIAGFVLLAGIAGYVGGIYTNSLQNTSPKRHPVSTDFSATDTSKAQDSGTSLSEQSGNTPFDITIYRESANRIILDYYNDDKESLTLHCEDLIATLYEDEALTRIAGTDYAGYDVIHKEDLAVPGTTKLRNSLAYRDQILYERLGSYQEYENYLFLQFYYLLNEATTDTENGLYQYAIASGTQADERYEQALVDIVSCVRYAFDMADSYPSPTEEYE